MQLLFDLGIEKKLAVIREGLRERFEIPIMATEREPIAALIKSIISSRTYDEVSLNAFNNLIAVYPRWQDMAAALPGAIEAAISEVTFAESKAVFVGEALHQIALTHPDFDLSFLGRESAPKALAWLETLPGMGRKVSAATVNFSTLGMAALVIDTHVLRVLQRLRLVSPKAGIEAAYDWLMPELCHWSASELSELHCLMKRLGQVHCRPAWPDCGNCPLSAICDSADNKPLGEVVRQKREFRVV